MHQTCTQIAEEMTLIGEDDEPPSQHGLNIPSLIVPNLLPFRYNSLIQNSRVQTVRHKTQSTTKTKIFRQTYYPEINDKEWNDWHWQISHRIRTFDRLNQILKLSYNEYHALVNSGVQLPLSITPYYTSLLSVDDPDQALRRSVVPTINEFVKMPCESDDPLGEEHQSPVPGLVHRYPDRVLFLLLDFCSTYCRYCTRSRVVGHGAINAGKDRLNKAIEYIRQTPSIRDVLLSGGDPLTLSDEKLEWVLFRLRQIPHVEIIRIGTKVTTVLPQRITPKLVRMLKKYHPLWMSLHFTHPDECTPETHRACSMLADAGIPLGSQTVLLKGMNDSVETMTELMHELMKMRVRPYYMYQCDPISGSSHFRTSVQKGLEIIKGMRGFTTGYAVPTYVVDAPGGGGKIPLMPDYVEAHTHEKLILNNYENKCFSYPDPLISGEKAVLQ
ncbi:L-lysine 2,3-aminomutase [Desulfonema limicola]|uniref:L-lysine 2,3-aminomutase n=1 Tax=Desulfonema limicola TaxID=45656 RepID=A0A975B7G3_9BACT|nr:KamA family radical SAM protein [Desulfonema limicola]QTA80299.1 L-lysine 2,3-aminomutase [Desulfonema limicola]